MFSSDSDGICELVGNTLRDGMEAMDFGILDILPVIGPWRMGRKLEHIHSIFSALDTSILKLVEARAKRIGPTDLLGRLVAARDLESGFGMTIQEVRDEVVIIFIAGHETTAVAMTFVWYLLSKHPWVEAKLHQELAAVLNGRAPKYEDLEHLPVHSAGDSGGDASLSASARTGGPPSRWPMMRRADGTSRKARRSR